MYFTGLVFLLSFFIGLKLTGLFPISRPTVCSRCQRDESEMRRQLWVLMSKARDNKKGDSDHEENNGDDNDSDNDSDSDNKSDDTKDNKKRIIGEMLDKLQKEIDIPSAAEKTN